MTHHSNGTNTINPVYWIGGSSCSGKSSQAQQIARAYGFTLYQTDVMAFGTYMFDIANKEQYPHIIRYRDLLKEGMDAFFQRPEEELFGSFLNYCREVFPLLFRDVQSHARKQPVLVEGAHVLPELVPRNHENSIFLVSTKQQQTRIWQQEMEGTIPGGHPGERENYHRAENKQQIEEQRTSFHDNIARYIKKTAQEKNLKVVVVDEKVSEAAVKAAILVHLNLYQNKR
jgi:hypothetical protein